MWSLYTLSDSLYPVCDHVRVTVFLKISCPCPRRQNNKTIANRIQRTQLNIKINWILKPSRMHHQWNWKNDFFGQDRVEKNVFYFSLKTPSKIRVSFHIFIIFRGLFRVSFEWNYYMTINMTVISKWCNTDVVDEQITYFLNLDISIILRFLSQNFDELFNYLQKWTRKYFSK